MTEEINKNNLDNINNTNTKEKQTKSIAELTKEGWEDTLTHFAHIRIYKKGNDKILYDTKTQTIEYRYFMPEENSLIN
jgi:hypothetical protein